MSQRGEGGSGSGGGRQDGEGFPALLRAGDVRTLLTRYSDMAQAGLVIAIVGMMIVPLPTPLLDLHRWQAWWRVGSRSASPAFWRRLTTGAETRLRRRPPAVERWRR